MAAKTPFVFADERFFNPRKFDSQAETGGPETAVRVNRQASQPARTFPNLKKLFRLDNLKYKNLLWIIQSII